MTHRTCWAVVLLAAAGCGDEPPGGSGESASASETGVSLSASADDDASGDGTQGSATQGSATQSDATSAADGPADATTDGVKFDVAEDGGTESDTMVGCECGSQIGFSYVWPSNSNIGQVSKINTQTMVEEGRYFTSAGGTGSPSRSSVSLSGFSVAVNNRNGGVVKIWSRSDDCDPMQNGVAGLQTSGGAADVLPWGEDDCVHWYIDPYNYTTQRPIGWIPATIDPVTCEYGEEKLWTSGCNSGVDPFIFADRVDGATGTVEDHVEVTGFTCDGFGGYGGAVDAMGNFWLSNLGATLGRVDHDTLEVQLWTIPITVYGITVDSSGRPWMSSNMGAGNSSAVRFDPMTETFELATGPVGSAQTGIQEDAFGRMWMNTWSYNGGAGQGVTYIDIDTMVTGPFTALPTYGKGISIDLDGMVWAIGTFTNNAARYDPITGQVDVYSMLDYPYTYSDMTGWALQNTTCNPRG